MTQAERPRATRFVRSFVVRYQSLEAGSNAWLTSTLRNFSSTGARFLCERAFRVGEAMVLQLVLPTSREPIMLKARVVWTKPSLLGVLEVGVAFEPSEMTAARAIADAADFYLRKKREAR